MVLARTAMTTMMKSLKNVKFTPRRGAARGHSELGWLDSYHTFSFADYGDSEHMGFGSIRVLNEDRVAPGTGFPTHPHRDFEIFSYIVSGELTHRDSMLSQGSAAENGADPDKFYRMHRGDVQFTTGGTGIAHSEKNEHAKDWVHFLQIWVLPWKKGLTPRYHTRTFKEADKLAGIVPLISPLQAGLSATAAAETEAVASIENTIPIHADLVFAASILPPKAARQYVVGGSSEQGAGPVVTKTEGRRAYIHVIMRQAGDGRAKIRLHGAEELSEGDGCYVDNLTAGDELHIENIGEAPAEFIILDSD